MNIVTTFFLGLYRLNLMQQLDMLMDSKVMMILAMAY
jgi:hypothetical protein